MTSLQALHNLYPMNITSLFFVYAYLPASLLVYYVAPEKLRPAVLLAVSLGFCALSQPQYILLLITSAALDYALTQGIILLKTRRWRRILLMFCVFKNLALIGYCGVMAELRMLTVPFGLAVFCLSGIDGALEAYKEENPKTYGFIPYALYISFFPRLYAGPLLPPAGFLARCERARFDSSGILLGFGRFAEGAFKYAVLGRGLFRFCSSVRVIPDAEVSVLSAWLLIISFALSLYFTMSGLADIARGIAGLFGISLPQNYYYPYQSRSVTDFFDRFNMTVGGFLKRTLLAALRSEKKDPVGDASNILLAGMLWGLWFGIHINLVVWGALIAAFMIMEKYFYPKLVSNAPPLFCRVCTLCVTFFGFTVFAGDTLAQSAGYFRQMLGVAGSLAFYNDRILYVLMSGRLLLVISCLLSTNLISLFVTVVRKSYPKAAAAMFGIADVCILLAFTVSMLGGGGI